MSFFMQLIETTDSSRRELEAISSVQDMLQGCYPEEKYINLLTDLYHIVLNFCPILAAAASRCSPEFIEVQNYLYDHIQDEKRHEILVLNDLAAFGVREPQVLSKPMSCPVQAMIGFNYYVQDRQHPCGVIGMIYVLEIISSVYGGQVTTAIAASLNRSTSNGFSFLDSHASMDMDHMSKLRKFLQSIESTEAQKMIVESVRMNFYLIAQIMKS